MLPTHLVSRDFVLMLTKMNLLNRNLNPYILNGSVSLTFSFYTETTHVDIAA